VKRARQVPRGLSVPGKTPFFFGLASTHVPKGAAALLDAPAVGDPFKMRARAPAH
jgi:hypothetical protein